MRIKSRKAMRNTYLTKVLMVAAVSLGLGLANRAVADTSLLVNGNFEQANLQSGVQDSYLLQPGASNPLLANLNLSSHMSVDNVTRSGAPEPNSLALVAVGTMSLFGIQICRRRRRC